MPQRLQLVEEKILYHCQQYHAVVLSLEQNWLYFKSIYFFRLVSNWRQTNQHSSLKWREDQSEREGGWVTKPRCCVADWGLLWPGKFLNTIATFFERFYLSTFLWWLKLWGRFLTAQTGRKRLELHGYLNGIFCCANNLHVNLLITQTKGECFPTCITVQGFCGSFPSPPFFPICLAVGCVFFFILWSVRGNTPKEPASGQCCSNCKSVCHQPHKTALRTWTSKPEIKKQNWMLSELPCGIIRASSIYGEALKPVKVARSCWTGCWSQPLAAQEWYVPSTPQPAGARDFMCTQTTRETVPWSLRLCVL